MYIEKSKWVGMTMRHKALKKGTNTVSCLLVLYDIIAVNLAYLIALWLRFDFSIYMVYHTSFRLLNQPNVKKRVIPQRFPCEINSFLRLCHFFRCESSACTMPFRKNHGVIKCRELSKARSTI